MQYSPEIQRAEQMIGQRVTYPVDYQTAQTLATISIAKSLEFICIIAGNGGPLDNIAEAIRNLDTNLSSILSNPGYRDRYGGMQ